MNWGSIGEFFAMGGYATYVWGAYGITAACIAFEIWSVLRRRQRAMKAAAAAVAAVAAVATASATEPRGAAR